MNHEHKKLDKDIKSFWKFSRTITSSNNNCMMKSSGLSFYTSTKIQVMWKLWKNVSASTTKMILIKYLKRWTKESVSQLQTYWESTVLNTDKITTFVEHRNLSKYIHSIWIKIWKINFENGEGLVLFFQNNYVKINWISAQNCSESFKWD